MQELYLSLSQDLTLPQACVSPPSPKPVPHSLHSPGLWKGCPRQSMLCIKPLKQILKNTPFRNGMAHDNPQKRFTCQSDDLCVHQKERVWKCPKDLTVYFYCLDGSVSVGFLIVTDPGSAWLTLVIGCLYLFCFLTLSHSSYGQPYEFGSHIVCVCALFLPVDIILLEKHEKRACEVENHF